MSEGQKAVSINYSGLQKGIPFSERPTCSINEACSAAGFGKTKMYELIDEGGIATIKIGRRRLVRVPSLLALLSKGDAAAGPH